MSLKERFQTTLLADLMICLKSLERAFPILSANARSNYMASMFGCYTTFDNLPDSSRVWNELEKEPVSIGKAALKEEELKAAWTAPSAQQAVLQVMRGLRENVGLPKLKLTGGADR